MVTQPAGIPGVATLLLPSGGHNYATDKPTRGQSFAWLAQVGAI